ncbi:MAG: DnaK suppressor protein [Planctomycetota bacterium]|jgi:DnaK suppressor protein
MAKKLTEQDLERYGSLLRNMLGILSGDIANLETETTPDVREGEILSSDDVGAEVLALELSMELLQHDEKTVGEIGDALDRIRAGTYGRCVACQAWIRKTRLSAVPHAPNCIDCQRAAEARVQG